VTIDKNYYDLSRKLLDELDRGMEEGPELSGAEMLARCAYAGEEAARLTALADAQMEEKRASLSPEKAEAFKALVEKADDLASNLGLNFHVRTRNGYQGVIRLVGEQLIIDSTWDDGERETLSQLIAGSSDLWMDITELNGKNVLQIEMCYDLSSAGE